MSEKVYIHDDFGNPIPLLDGYGNLSMQVIMLYAEDRLTEADRKTVDQLAATDEMTRDALDGFGLTASTAKARTRLAEVNAHIQKTTGAAAVASVVTEKPKFDYRRMAAAIAALVIIGAGSFFLAEYLRKPHLADGTATEEASPAVQFPAETLDTDGGPEQLDEALAEESERAGATGSVEAEQPNEIPTPQEPRTTTLLKSAEPEPERAQVKPKRIEEQLTESTLKSEPIRTDNSQAGNQAFQDPTAQTKAPAAGLASGDTNKAKKNENARNAAEPKAAELADDVMEVVAETAATAPQLQQQAQMETERQQTGKDRTRAAKYPGGDMAMYKFIERKKVYTPAMQAQGMNGAVSVTFDIEPDGRVANAKVKSGVFGPLNEDALRVVRSMPNWQPAQNASGENIRSTRTVVVTYGQ